MSTTTRRAAATATAAAVLLTTIQLTGIQVTAAPAAAADPDMELVDVVVSGDGDVSSGFGTLTVDVTLRSTSGLPDVLIGGAPSNEGNGETYAVYAQPADARPWRVTGESPPDLLGWARLTRVSGTPHDGVWRGTTVLTGAYGGNWLLTSVQDYGGQRYTWLDVSDRGITFEVADGAPPAWVAAPAPLAPVRVVTGNETWVPRVRVTDRATGAGVGAFLRIHKPDASEPHLPLSPRLPAGTALQRADAQGYRTLPALPVAVRYINSVGQYVDAYGGRGSRGYSREARTLLLPHVKWQANERFAVSGGTLVASGNVWPAPIIHPAANQTVHLQQLVGRTWRTVVSRTVRYTGRYSIEWSPGPGTYVVRVYKPGGSEPVDNYMQTAFRTSVGTTLPAVTLTVP